ncbi:unnamed protein product, partial [Cyprideis torosa]
MRQPTLIALSSTIDDRKREYYEELAAQSTGNDVTKWLIYFGKTIITAQQQTIRQVDFLENDGRGLNLSFEVRNGIIRHSKGNSDIFPESPSVLALTLEGQVVRLADIIAYVNHDLDDAIRAGIIQPSGLPGKISQVVGERHSQRISNMVRDVIVETLRGDD